MQCANIFKCANMFKCGNIFKCVNMLKRIAMNDLAWTYRSCDCDIHALLYRLCPEMLEIRCSAINSIRAGMIVDDSNVLTGPTKEFRRKEGESCPGH